LILLSLGRLLRSAEWRKGEEKEKAPGRPVARALKAARRPPHPVATAVVPIARSEFFSFSIFFSLNFLKIYGPNFFSKLYI
jgi:hypothetical protein